MTFAGVIIAAVSAGLGSSSAHPWAKTSYTRCLRSVASIGRWSARRPWRAIALWLEFVAVAAAIGVVSGIRSLDNGAVGESARGSDLMAEHQRLAAGPRVRLPAQRHAPRATRVPRRDATSPTRIASGRSATSRFRSRPTGMRPSSRTSRIVSLEPCARVLAAGAAIPASRSSRPATSRPARPATASSTATSGAPSSSRSRDAARPAVRVRRDRRRARGSCSR